jgi:hypothetical protein
MDPISLDLLSGVAGLGGFAWTDDELQAVAPQVERGLAALEKLAALPLRDLDPSTVFRAE